MCIRDRVEGLTPEQLTAAYYEMLRTANIELLVLGCTAEQTAAVKAVSYTHLIRPLALQGAGCYYIHCKNTCICEVNKLERRFYPVSYTHLDVYKRQPSW